MIVYSATGKGGVKIPYPHDADSVALYFMEWGVDAWATNTFYQKDDEVKPIVNNGLVYVCVKPGLSDDTTAPVWPVEIGETVTDGTVTWKCKGNTRHLAIDESIISSSWAGPTGFEYASQDFSNGKTWVSVSAVPENETSVILTNTIETDKGQTLQASMILKIADR